MSNAPLHQQTLQTTKSQKLKKGKRGQGKSEEDGRAKKTASSRGCPRSWCNTRWAGGLVKVKCRLFLSEKS